MALLTPGQVCRLLNIDQRSLHRYAVKGIIRKVVLGSHPRYDHRELLDYVHIDDIEAVLNEGKDVQQHVDLKAIQAQDALDSAKVGGDQ